VLAVLSAAFPLLAQSAPASSIPRNAVVIERARVSTTIHPDRELLLWMISPVKHDRGLLSSENAYTCPEMTLGSYYSGPTRLSLLDTRSGQLINTIKLVSPDLDDKKDEFNIPYRIISGGYYLVPGVPREAEGKPVLLKLRDLNGDGIAAETAFFEAEACMGLPTTLIGYSVAQDKVIQYQAEIEVTDFERKVTGDGLGPRHRKGKPKVETQVWIDYLLSEKPGEPGHWKYKIDYSGRGGCEDSYDLRYDPAGEKFVGTLTELCYLPDHQSPAKN
jgi:hypothetical protein